VVAIVQRRMTHYRVPLFEQMRRRLQSQGVELRVLHGDGTPEEASKADAGELSWAVRLPTRYAFGGRLCWQPFAHAVRDCDLLVVTQENKLLNNLPLVLAPGRRTPVAFWGHGRDMQAARPEAWSERFKAWTTRRVDWWFAYTEVSAACVRATGFSPDRITVLHNSIDTSELRHGIAEARRLDRRELRREFGLGAGPVGLYIGSLYADKRIPWLIDAAVRLREQVPNFELLVAGAGPERAWVEQAARRHDFIRYVGMVRDARKARCLVSADLVLNPGLVGLGILDAFVAGLPLITTDCKLHSPEIAYLESGRNGLMTANDLECYVSSCLRLILDREARARMGAAAAESADEYSIERMSERFCSGLIEGLARGRGRLR
jgi:glycosyltransferase involved in cell wall biosynthesis